MLKSYRSKLRIFNWHRMGPINNSFVKVNTNSLHQLVENITNPFDKTQQAEVMQKLENNPKLMGQIIEFLQVKIGFHRNCS